MGALLQGAGTPGLVVPVSVQGSADSNSFDFNAGAGYSHHRCPFTTNAARTISSIDVKMHGGGTTAVLTVRTSAGVVVATSNSTAVSGAMGFKTYTFPTSFALPAGDYFLDFQWPSNTSPEVGNGVKTLTGVVTACGNSLGGYSYPAATLFNGYATFVCFKLNGTP